MAKSKKCKKCDKYEKDCTCPKRGRLGYYGLDRDDSDDKHMGNEDMVPSEGGDGGGSMGEAVKMPTAPQETDKDMEGMSSEKKQKKLTVL